jgi:hypothetical protein
MQEYTKKKLLSNPIAEMHNTGYRPGLRPSRKNWIIAVILLCLGLWLVITVGTRKSQMRASGDGDDDVDYSTVEVVGKWPEGRKKVVLLTGGAGFIGSHTARFLLGRGDDVIIVDEVNDYYDITIKEDNLAFLSSSAKHVHPPFFIFLFFDIYHLSFIRFSYCVTSYLCANNNNDTGRRAVVG